MKILIVPMFALSPMEGPWSRVQKIAHAFMSAGHDVTLGFAEDGNCRNPVSDQVLHLPVPSPLGLPHAISSCTFPCARKLGIAGRKSVRSFEEVLWLTGALAYGYERKSIEAIRSWITCEHPDVIYSEFSLPAIIAASAEGVPCVGTASLPTRATYACAPQRAVGVRKVLDELGLDSVRSSLELLDRMRLRCVPSCARLEPFGGEGVVHCGFLEDAPRTSVPCKDAVVIYMGTGSVSPRTLERTARGLAARTNLDVFATGCSEPTRLEGNLHLAHHFDFSELMPRAALFVNHGGQNSIMDALAYGVPQAVYPGNVFERQFNAASIANAHAGVTLEEFSGDALLHALEVTQDDASCVEGARALREELSSLGGTKRIVEAVEKHVKTR